MAKIIIRQLLGGNGPVIYPKKKKEVKREEQVFSEPAEETRESEAIPCEEKKCEEKKCKEEKCKEKRCEEENLDTVVNKQFEQVQPGVFCFKFPYRTTVPNQQIISQSMGLMSGDNTGFPSSMAGYREAGVTRDGMKVYSFT